MARDFKLPDLGEGVHEGQVVRVLVSEGETVKEDQPLMEVETDKAAVEIPCPFSGVVQKIHVAEQQVVNVGDVMVTFSDDGAAAAERGETTRRRATAGNGASSPTITVTTTTPPRGGRRKPASPAVRSLARRMGVDLERVSGSGPGGRITRSDVEQFARSGPKATPATGPAPPQPSPAAPARVTPPPPPPPVAPAVTLASIEGTAGTDSHGEIVRQPLTRIRQTISDNMMQSWSTIPHVTDVDDADVTVLDELRREFNVSNPDAGKLTMLPFVIRAVAIALHRHPVFNASYDAEKHEIIYKRYINIAVGVHTERGLVAPVLRSADRLSVMQIQQALNDLTHRARTASFEVNELRGGTFTISNAGAMGGSRYSTPIINPPQVAVLAVGRTKRLPWVVDDAVVPRLIMPLSVSFDHRIIDGGAEVAFARDVIGSLENPVRLM